MGKCNDCKHGRTEFEKGTSSIEGMTLLNENKESCLGNMYGICDNGNQDTFVKWWKAGIGIPSSETKDVECYEPTEHTKKLDKIIELADDMLNTLKSK